MTQEERILELEELVRTQGKVTLEHICQQYKISYDSARRDLVKLTKIPGILRIRGGAIASERRINLSYAQRGEFTPAKELLAQQAINLINDDEIIFIDAGTTLAAFAHHLHTPSTVITNSIEALNEIRGKDYITKYMLGGMYDDFSHTILGNATIEQINKYKADKAFIGVGALSESGITTDSEIDAALKLAMAKQSRQVICITTFSKFNLQAIHQSCSWTDINYIITDKTPPNNIMKLIEDNDVELIVLDNITSTVKDADDSVIS